MRVVDEGLRQLHALAHPGRVAAHLAVALLEQPHVAKGLRRALACGGTRETVDLRHVSDELGGADLERKAVVLRHVPDQLPDGEPVRGNVETEHLRPSGRGLDQPEEDLDQRALAGAVRADEADHARLELEVQVVEGEDGAETLRQSTRRDQRHDVEPR